jgi:hypothetical protein
MTTLPYTAVKLMLTLVLCGRAHAQIGWTEAQCRKAYGLGIVTAAHPDYVSYTRGGLTILTHLTGKDTVDSVTYAKLSHEPFTQAEIQKLLRNNGGTLEWRSEGAVGQSLKWTAFDTQGRATLGAMYDDSTFPADLAIFTQEYLSRER